MDSTRFPLAGKVTGTLSPRFQPFAFATDVRTRTPSAPSAAAEPAVTLSLTARSTVEGSTDEYVAVLPAKRAEPVPVADTAATPGTARTSCATSGLKLPPCPFTGVT